MIAVLVLATLGLRDIWVPVYFILLSRASERTQALIAVPATLVVFGLWTYFAARVGKAVLTGPAARRFLMMGMTIVGLVAVLLVTGLYLRMSTLHPLFG